MYNKATIDQIAGALGLNAEEFATGISSEDEQSLTLPSGRFLTSEQVETIKDNHGKTRYDAGAEASRDMLLKDMSKKVGFEESIKDPTKFIDTFKANILKEAKVEPNQKLAEAETSISNLRNKITEMDTDYLKLQSEVTEKEVRFNVKSFIPDIPESLGISKDDATNLFFLANDIKEDGVYKNGVHLKDSLEKPLTVQEAVSSFITDKGWNTKPSGRGGGSGGGTGGSLPKTMEDYQSTLKERGLSEGSAEANALLTEIAKENPEILD